MNFPFVGDGFLYCEYFYIHQVLAITEDLHDVHSLGKEAATVHCSLVEDLSKVILVSHLMFYTSFLYTLILALFVPSDRDDKYYNICFFFRSEILLHYNLLVDNRHICCLFTSWAGKHNSSSTGNSIVQRCSCYD